MVAALFILLLFDKAVYMPYQRLKQIVQVPEGAVSSLGVVCYSSLSDMSRVSALW
jgi:hypothetical protein